MSLNWPVHRFDEIDSTNEEAKRRWSAPPREPCWIVARSQSSGRGRLGRVWRSPVGNLYTTVSFCVTGGVARAAQAPFAAALAVHDVFSRLSARDDIRLKWPNDVRWNRQKLSGILVETADIDGDTWCATGMGLNVAFTPSDAGQAAASLSDLRRDSAIDAETAFEALREAFAQRLVQLDDGFDSVRTDWLARAEGLGEPVKINASDHPVEGVLEGMAADGGLEVRLPDGSLRVIRAGDVELIKEAR